MEEETLGEAQHRQRRRRWQRQRQRRPALVFPPEIALRIASWLQPESSTVYPLCQRRAPSPYRMGDVLAFASTCLSLRCILAPLVWSSLVFHEPERLEELHRLLEYYQQDGRDDARSRRCTKRRSISSSSSPARAQDAVKERPPSPSILRHDEDEEEEDAVQALEDDDEAPSFEFDLLTFEPDDENRPRLPPPLPLVRNFFLAFPRRVTTFNVAGVLDLIGKLPALEYLSWDAEITPPASLWDIVTPSIRGLHVDCKVFWQGNPGLSKLAELESLTLTTYDANLLPNHVPTLLLNLPTPLTELDMSTSKTSVLHEDRLIEAGCFSRLEYLTLFAVTPEPPLDKALASAGGSLRTLNLFADINGGFRNYDDLWRNLTGQMHVLEDLTVDPHPQQNTAPSFEQFLQGTPSLRRINGREASGLPPCLSLFDPDHLTSALAY